MYRSTCLIAFLAVVACAYAAPAGETASLPPGEINSGSKLENRPVPDEERPLILLERQTPILETPRKHQLAPPLNEKADSDSAGARDFSSEDSDLDTDASHHHYRYYEYYAPGWSGWVGRSYGWHGGWKTHYWY